MARRSSQVCQQSACACGYTTRPPLGAAARRQQRARSYRRCHRGRRPSTVPHCLSNPPRSSSGAQSSRTVVLEPATGMASIGHDDNICNRLAALSAPLSSTTSSSVTQARRGGTNNSATSRGARCGLGGLKRAATCGTRYDDNLAYRTCHLSRERGGAFRMRLSVGTTTRSSRRRPVEADGASSWRQPTDRTPRCSRGRPQYLRRTSTPCTRTMAGARAARSMRVAGSTSVFPSTYLRTS